MFEVVVLYTARSFSFALFISSFFYYLVTLCDLSCANCMFILFISCVIIVQTMLFQYKYMCVYIYIYIAVIILYYIIVC